MSSLNNINNNSSVVSVGRTTPITPGPQPSSKSLPVVVASDQEAIPVEEQNKIQSEVALSLLGIPRAEVALGIFADVNTYDVNPKEWSSNPSNYSFVSNTEKPEYADISGPQGYGVKHLPEESGALVESPADDTTILTSKRFFRYQPGRVSSATFGIKSSKLIGDITERNAVKNPPIKKFGIFDKFDGYYWETRDTSQGDQFAVVRRTQSIMSYNPLKFGSASGQQLEDHGLAGQPADIGRERVGYYQRECEIVNIQRFEIIDTVVGSKDPKYARDFHLIIDAFLNDLRWGGDGHTVVNSTTYRTTLNETPAAFVASLEALRDEINLVLTDSGYTEASSKITSLSQILIDFFTSGNISNLSNINWGDRPKVDTIISGYDKYLGFLISSEADFEGVFAGQTQEMYELFRYKTLLDIKFIANAIGSDTQYGGNAATVYTSKNNYSNNELIAAAAVSEDGKQLLITAYQRLKEFLTSTTSITVELSNGTTKDIDSVVNLFSLSEAQRTKLKDLSDIAIDNFDEEYQGIIDYGSADQFGDTVILRDGLIMTHAAVYDPSLLLPKEMASSLAYPDTNTVVTSGRELVSGQYVNYHGDAGGLVSGKTYRIASVAGFTANEITLEDPMNNAPVVITSSGTSSVIETPVPFIFPDDYDEPFLTETSPTNYDGMFPYQYISEDDPMGAIDTSIDTSTVEGSASMQAQIDAVNYKFNNWVLANVDPRYYSVYEFRVPRSRFSGDSLNGKKRQAVYSDNVLDKRAGDPVIEDGVRVEQQSLWDFDFSKVSMLKIDFSWYGAVGALFLAYVPASNGEARWVRVHHLRCSNQLKISSLGNATLPITYLVYGGGSERRMGLENSARLPSNYNSYSEHLVKYGSSYYIDGGDRGTVRLYNHSSDEPTEIQGSKYNLDISDASDATDTTDPRFIVSSNTNVNTFYMNAKIVTGNPQDQSVRVVWVDEDTNTLHLNKILSGNSFSTVGIITDRPSILYGIKTKDFITSSDGKDVRNRVQVYPTRLSLGTNGSGSGKASLLKTPLFQTKTMTFGSISTTSDMNLNETRFVSVDNEDYIKEFDDFVYGYFRALKGNSSSLFTVLGTLTKKANGLSFVPLDSFNTDIIIPSGQKFLKEGIFDSNGNSIEFNEGDFEKERLSSVEVSVVNASPIPRTGVDISSFYVSGGAQDFDLSSYFDYNKEYISYPLTDSLETLYIVGSSTIINNSTPAVSISASLTWEEQ